MYTTIAPAATTTPCRRTMTDEPDRMVSMCFVILAIVVLAMFAI